MADKMLFAQRLHDVMRAQNVDVPELAHRVGAVETTVGRWVKGETDPSISRVMQIADALDVPASMLLEYGQDQFEAGRRSIIGAIRRELSKLEGDEMQPEDMDGGPLEEAPGIDEMAG